MKSSTKLLAVLALVLIANVSASAQSSYRKKLHTYLDLAGSSQTFKAAISQMVGSFSKMNEKVPAEFWTGMEKELNETSIADLVELIGPVYEQHLTESDLDAIIAFYNTPAGKKLAEKTPIIMVESMKVGEIWGQQVGRRVIEKMKAAGYN